MSLSFRDIRPYIPRFPRSILLKWHDAIDAGGLRLFGRVHWNMEPVFLPKITIAPLSTNDVVVQIYATTNEIRQRQ